VRSTIEPVGDCAVTLVDGVLVCRAFAMQADTVKGTFIKVWRTLRPMLLEREVMLPRIWAT
jgi:urease accessory protein